MSHLSKTITFRGKRYTYYTEVSNKHDAQTMVNRIRKQHSAAQIREENGKFIIYTR